MIARLSSYCSIMIRTKKVFVIRYLDIIYEHIYKDKTQHHIQEIYINNYNSIYLSKLILLLLAIYKIKILRNAKSESLCLVQKTFPQMRKVVNNPMNNGKCDILKVMQLFRNKG